MAIKEAIRILERIQMGEIYDVEDYCFDAIDLAIEALRQEDEMGEWHFNSDPRCGDFICSECLERSIVRSKYCPNCGRKMRIK